jgi:ArsR family transcriptional regulator, zinc-responsive transcriptional repressor
MAIRGALFSRQRGEFHGRCHVRLGLLSCVGYYLRIDAGSGIGATLAEDQVGLVVEVFRMLADATRIQVLWALAGQERSVTELAEQVGKPAPSVSQHLTKLRMARLARTRRAGTTIFYSLDNEHVRQLVVDAVFNAEHAGPGIPSHHRHDLTMRDNTSTTELALRKANRR